jgi:hypothetical protein
MLRKLRPRSAYDVMAALALFIALGGTALAAVAANSVGTAQLKNGAVTRPKLAANSVDSSKLAAGSVSGPTLARASVDGSKVSDRSLTADDIDLATLPGSEGWHGLPHPATRDCNTETNVGQTYCIAGSGNDYSQWDDSFYVSNYGYSDPAYYRDRDGTVHLRGLAACTDHGSSTWCGDTRFTLFYLPPGYRPYRLIVMQTIAGSGSGLGDHFINIYPDGRVRADGSPALKTYISLDGLSFRCNPVGSDGCK